ncbi:MAG: DUF1287 domain-containing protein [Syntrophomonadaceae bacterium]|jgi:uncharacterized protein YijF (DUF1287 family)|nr:DUF1287 domain-containing protein [Syntrophomonadaceae bacterium]
MKKMLGLMCTVLAAIGIYYLSYYNLIPQKTYTAEDFGIETVISKNDRNGNGIDDYTDIMLGARADAKNKPRYKSAYYAGGYPPENEGVCTDLVWRAFLNAGYSLKDMVNADIGANVEAYPRVDGKPDPNIDFRRVPNLKVFFERNATSLTLDPYEIEAWQPGDIVTYGTSHIAIVSDKRNRHGMAYIIHNGGQPVREEDALTRQEISGHYRFDTTK